jgi:predicted nucleotidyltransferase
MAADLNEQAADAASDFVRALGAPWQARLGDNLIGLYLIGSLAHGGFSARYSDIDVALVTEAGVSPEALAELRDDAALHSAELARKLSFFWTDRSFALGRFPPLDRGDYRDRAVVLLEREHVVPARPTLEGVRSYLCGAPFANWQRSAERFAASDALDPSERKAYLRAHLYPARFVYAFMTGRMASNDEAVAYLAAQSWPGFDVGLIARALACRVAGADPDPLFADRTRLPRHVAACAHLVRESEAERP